MRSLFLSAALAAVLISCSPPQREAEAPREQAPQVQACNALAPNLALMVRVEEQTATPALATELRGGAVTPGLYDLARAVRIGQATGWQGERAVVLEVTEDAGGVVTFNWAGAAPGGAIDTWTARFSDSGEHPIMSYTCGRVGDVAAEFTAQPNALTLRLPDGANGSLQLDFAKRS